MSEELIRLLCICDEEMCFCTNMVLMPLGVIEMACPECDQGFHVWEMLGERDYGGLEYIGPPQ